MQATDKASSLDLKAATAQAEHKELQEVAGLYQQAASAWGLAVDNCEGRAQERAKRNLADSEKVLASVSELQGSGPQCESTQKDAAALNGLARQAADDKRYADASVLYRKAADMWDIASERCSGSQQKLAANRRAQSETDAYNAEYCVPVYEQAREQTQRLKSMSSGLSAAEKKELSSKTEIAWREAGAKCRGAAVDIALNNAQALAKERGTPLPPGSYVPTAPAKAAVTATPVQLAAQPAPISQPPKEVDASAGDTRFTGKFTLDPDGKTYSGIGRVSWTNGDVYEGSLARGHREGRGKFTWPSGQVYDGEWRGDAPNGQGVMKFANGNRYEGTIVNGVPNGSGKMEYANGDSYSGDMIDGVPSGRGTFFWKSGDRYSGQWKAGLKEGNGTFSWSNGDRWEGVYRNDQQTDAGKLIRRSEQAPEVATRTTTRSTQ
ncbi:hypothetical protein [Noviherbaspirillum pedocola]|uniref:MORN repeat-containing protein n=1 Tax=Noviherbaspirillum pedocola TaxID=2801341 RepID=A0A934T1Z1_9BURK|nr:hypothetical protein [Noviherbaspirillum pedocola]MBK4737717.1 hypothetical protein [Noviherbaspirillum pedocola]